MGMLYDLSAIGEIVRMQALASVCEPNVNKRISPSNGSLRQELENLNSIVLTSTQRDILLSLSPMWFIAMSIYEGWRDCDSVEITDDLSPEHIVRLLYELAILYFEEAPISNTSDGR